VFGRWEDELVGVFSLMRSKAVSPRSGYPLDGSYLTPKLELPLRGRNTRSIKQPPPHTELNFGLRHHRSIATSCPIYVTPSELQGLRYATTMTPPSVRLNVDKRMQPSSGTTPRGRGVHHLSWLWNQMLDTISRIVSHVGSVAWLCTDAWSAKTHYRCCGRGRKARSTTLELSVSTPR